MTENTLDLDATDRALINQYQGGVPISESPYADMGQTLGIDEADVINRITKLLECGALSRFGPMYHAERLGGSLSLAAMIVPDDVFNDVTNQVNAHTEVSQNYAREHTLNMWFVIACDDKAREVEVISKIEQETGLAVFNMPKIREYFVGFHVKV